MALFLLRFWPVFLPMAVYVVWMVLVRRAAKKAGAPLPHFREGPWFWALVASLGLAVCMFIFLGLSHNPNAGDYIPPHIENGRIISGGVKSP